MISKKWLSEIYSQINIFFKYYKIHFFPFNKQYHKIIVILHNTIIMQYNNRNEYNKRHLMLRNDMLYNTMR